MAKPHQVRAGYNGQGPQAFHASEPQQQQSMAVAQVRLELDMILDAIGLIDGDPRNSEIIKEIRNGGSYQAILTTASRIVGKLEKEVENDYT